jgi:hypothetical protein
MADGRSADEKDTCIKVGFDHLIHATTQMRPNLLAKRNFQIQSRPSLPRVEVVWAALVEVQEQLVTVLNGVHSSTWT